MLDSDTQKKLTDLSADAFASLSELLQLDELKSEQWFMRRSFGGGARCWELLTSDSKENDLQIKDRIAGSEGQVTEMVLAFIGMVEWHGTKQLMAYLQCFRAGYKEGILCLRPVEEIIPGKQFEARGEFMIVGRCQNIWI
jgi:hypothetical protein